MRARRAAPRGGAGAWVTAPGSSGRKSTTLPPPRPRRVVSSSASRSAPIASRSVDRDTPMRSASSRSGGSVLAVGVDAEADRRRQHLDARLEGVMRPEGPEHGGREVVLRVRDDVVGWCRHAASPRGPSLKVWYRTLSARPSACLRPRACSPAGSNSGLQAHRARGCAGRRHRAGSRRPVRTPRRPCTPSGACTQARPTAGADRRAPGAGRSPARPRPRRVRAAHHPTP